MLFTKNFIIQNNLFRTINYFICLIKANDEEQQLTNIEYDQIYLTQEITHKIIAKANLSASFPGTTQGDYVFLSSLTDKGMSIDLLKQKLSNATLHIRTTESDQTNKEDKDTYGVVTNNQTKEYKIYMNKAKWDSLVTEINSYKDNERVEIYLKTSTNKIIHLVTIDCINANQIKICKPIGFPHTGYLEGCVQRNTDFYNKSYQECLLNVLKILKKQIEENKTAISNIQNNIRLQVDMNPIILMYATKYTPSLTFFDEYSIKLDSSRRMDLNAEPFKRLTCKPSIFLEVCRLKNNCRNEINFQIFKYKYSTATKKYDIGGKPFSYINFEFGRNLVDTNRKEISVFTNIQALETSFVFTIKFFKEPGNWDSTVYEYFKNSVKQIEIETYGENDSLVGIQNDQFSIKNEPSEILFDIGASLINQDNQEFKSLFDILKKRKGVFGIRVRTEDKIIIDHKVFLNGEDMLVLSSNRLREHLSSLKPEVGGEGDVEGDDVRDSVGGGDVRGGVGGTPSVTNKDTETLNTPGNRHNRRVSGQEGRKQPGEKSTRQKNRTKEPSQRLSPDDPRGAVNKNSNRRPSHSARKTTQFHSSGSLHAQQTLENATPFQSDRVNMSFPFKQTTSAVGHETMEHPFQQYSQKLEGVYNPYNEYVSSINENSHNHPEISFNKHENTHNVHIKGGKSHEKSASINSTKQGSPLENTTPGKTPMASPGAADTIHIGQETENELFGQSINASSTPGESGNSPTQQDIETPNSLNNDTPNDINPTVDTQGQSNGQDTSTTNTNTPSISQATHEPTNTKSHMKTVIIISSVVGVVAIGGVVGYIYLS